MRDKSATNNKNALCECGHEAKKHIRGSCFAVTRIYGVKHSTRVCPCEKFRPANKKSSK